MGEANLDTIDRIPERQDTIDMFSGYRRIIKTSDPTSILVLDDSGAGGACHKYEVVDNEFPFTSFLKLHFQEGPVRENGVNGCTNEDLLRIIIDRLDSFQTGPFPCEENGKAIDNCLEALYWLERRTTNRKSRGVEGASKA